MAKIKQIAIAVENPDKAAKFYSETFGMKIIGKWDDDREEGYFLTDGDLNLALTKFKTEEAAAFIEGVEGGTNYKGLHHIGFHVDDYEKACSTLEETIGNKAIPATNTGFAKFKGPNGEIIEISETGWPGMSATLTTDQAYINNQSARQWSAGWDRGAY